MCKARNTIENVYRKASCYQFATACSIFDAEDVLYMYQSRKDVFGFMVAYVEFINETTHNGDCAEVCAHETLGDALNYLSEVSVDFMCDLIYKEWQLNHVYTIKW